MVEVGGHHRGRAAVLPAAGAHDRVLHLCSGTRAGAKKTFGPFGPKVRGFDQGVRKGRVRTPL